MSFLSHPIVGKHEPNPFCPWWKNHEGSKGMWELVYQKLNWTNKAEKDDHNNNINSCKGCHHKSSWIIIKTWMWNFSDENVLVDKKAPKQKFGWDTNCKDPKPNKSSQKKEKTKAPIWTITLNCPNLFKIIPRGNWQKLQNIPEKSKIITRANSLSLGNQPLVPARGAPPVP